MYKYLPYTLGRQTYVLELAVGICMLSAQRWLFAPPFAASFPYKGNKRKRVVPETIHNSPPPPTTEGNGNSEGSGAGAPKEGNFREGEGLFTEVFSRGSE